MTGWTVVRTDDAHVRFGEARAVDGVSPRRRAGRGLALVGESGSGQDDVDPGDPGTAADLVGQRHVLRRRPAGVARKRGAAPTGPDGLPGPDRCAEPAPDDLRDRRRGLRIRARSRRRTRTGRRCPVPGRPAAARAVPRPLPARDLGWATPAGRHRRRDGHGPEAARSPTNRSHRSTPRSAARSWR